MLTFIETSRKTTSSKADAFLQLRDKLHNATQLMNITTPTFDGAFPAQKRAPFSHYL